MHLKNLQLHKVAGDKGISEMKSKQQSPCSNCMHQPVMSWGNACSTCMYKPVRCMHWPVHTSPVTSQADACTYCMGSKVSSLSQIYLYSSYFDSYTRKQHIFRNLWNKFLILAVCWNLAEKKKKKIFF